MTLTRRAGSKALLRAHGDAGSFLWEQSNTTDFTLDQAPLSEEIGTLIGPYKLHEEIGEGGMGSVFMALQKKPVRRKVALKVIKPGMDSKQVVSRFEAERQALAMMDHPNIAHVHDGGTTDSGRPYFVMELVKGIPITDYCDRIDSRPDDRLELFRRRVPCRPTRPPERDHSSRSQTVEHLGDAYLTGRRFPKSLTSASPRRSAGI